MTAKLTENMKLYQHEYYINNKEKLNSYRKVRNLCELCGGKYTTINKSVHYKSIKHQNQLSLEKGKPSVFSLVCPLDAKG